MECSMYSYVQKMEMRVEPFHISQNIVAKECISALGAVRVSLVV